MADTRVGTTEFSTLLSQKIIYDMMARPVYICTHVVLKQQRNLTFRMSDLECRAQPPLSASACKYGKNKICNRSFLTPAPILKARKGRALRAEESKSQVNLVM